MRTETVSEPLLSMEGIHKRFPGVHALDGVNFTVRSGEVHALMGQNGAGKSTLIKVLTGVYPRNTGRVLFDGKPFSVSSPADAQRKGISTIYQEVNLIPSLSVMENLYLGRAPRRWFGIDYRKMRQRAQERLAEFDLEIDPDALLGSYSVAIQQMVGIARAVDGRAKLIVFDEPTSSLDRHETRILFDMMARLKQRGIGIIFVTHFLDQVYQVSDRITVLRNGRLVGTYDAEGLTKRQLIEHMIGRSPEQLEAVHEPQRTGVGDGMEGADEELLTARGLGRRGAVEPFDMGISRGEVLGLAGLLGSGRTESVRLLFGADRPDVGEIVFNSEPLPPGSPARAIAVGIGFCPEERKTEGIIPDLSVRDNIGLVVQRHLSRFGIYSRKTIDRIAMEFVKRLDIATPDVDRPVKSLSGGNQQKVILARWLACEPKLLILDEPTRGIDVGAKVEVEQLIRDFSRQGMAMVFISTELDEVVRSSHRIMVFRDRRTVGTLRGDQITEQNVLNTIAGAETDAA